MIPLVGVGGQDAPLHLEGAPIEGVVPWYLEGAGGGVPIHILQGGLSEGFVRGGGL